MAYYDPSYYDPNGPPSPHCLLPGETILPVLSPTPVELEGPRDFDALVPVNVPHGARYCRVGRTTELFFNKLTHNLQVAVQFKRERAGQNSYTGVMFNCIDNADCLDPRFNSRYWRAYRRQWSEYPIWSITLRNSNPHSVGRILTDMGYNANPTLRHVVIEGPYGCCLGDTLRQMLEASTQPLYWPRATILYCHRDVSEEEELV